MRVYLDDAGEKTLLGEADILPESLPVLEVPLFAGASIVRERFTIGTLTHLPEGGGLPIVERAVLLAPGQVPELPPGWRPLLRQ
jgi:hypothetical protein